MICDPCKRADHERCPELPRQADESLPVALRAGSCRCTCQHAAQPAEGATEGTMAPRAAVLRARSVMTLKGSVPGS